MQGNRSAIQLIGLIMSKQQLDVNYTLDLVQILNSSFISCKDIITIFEDIFKHEKSSKILIAVQALQYFVKNCNLNFHKAANRQSFQKRLLALLNRIRGKTNLIKQLNSNTDNWCRIEAKVLYTIQLWYDAFMLQQSKYSYIINTYKVLRKQNITFPPRSKNEKNLIFVQTQSPIFDNIEVIAKQDQKKFNKKLNSLGMGHLALKMQNNIQQLEQRLEKDGKNKRPEQKMRQVNVDDVSQKIAILQSMEYGLLQTIQVIQEIRDAIEYGRVKANEEEYWKQIKVAAQRLIQEWEQKNAEVIQKGELEYLQRKLGMMGISAKEKKPSLLQVDEGELKIHSKPAQTLDLLDQFEGFNKKTQKQQKKDSENYPSQQKQVNLLDL